MDGWRDGNSFPQDNVTKEQIIPSFALILPTPFAPIVRPLRRLSILVCDTRASMRCIRASARLCRTGTEKWFRRVEDKVIRLRVGRCEYLLPAPLPPLPLPHKPNQKHHDFRYLVELVSLGALSSLTGSLVMYTCVSLVM